MYLSFKKYSSMIECHVLLANNLIYDLDSAFVVHKDMKMYFNIKKFPTLTFCGPHYKHHVKRGLSKHYHLIFDPKLGNGACAICRISCAYFSCTSMLDKP